MIRQSLGQLYRQGARAGIDADDVARLLAGEHLGSRHAAAVESLASSTAASSGWRVAASLKDEIAGLTSALHEASTVVAFTPRPARVRHFAPWAAAAAIAALAVALSTLRSPMDPVGHGLAEANAPAGSAAADTDLISRFSWEEGALIAAAPADIPAPKPEPDAVFVDEFGAAAGS